MRYIGWTLLIGFWLFLAAFLHYTLPQRDVVRVTGTEIIRKDFSGVSRLFYAQADSGDSDVGNRDLRLINTCLLYTSPSPRDRQKSRMPSSA